MHTGQFGRREDFYLPQLNMQKRLIAVVRGEGKRRRRQEEPWLGKEQCALCKKCGHWKNQCPEQKRNGKGNRGREVVVAHAKDN